MDGLSNSDQGSASSRPGLGDPRSRSPMHAKKNAKRGVCTPALSTPSQFELSSVLGGPGAQAVRDCCRGHRGVVGVSGMGKKPRRSRPPGGIWAALRGMSSSLMRHVILPQS